MVILAINTLAIVVINCSSRKYAFNMYTYVKTGFGERRLPRHLT